jgi:uncharacterized membrane protein
MAPLIVQILAWLAFRLSGAMGLYPRAESWLGALAPALAVMFLFTGAAHFVPRTRDEMRRMVPPSFPRPALLVALTGALEIAGAIGLLVPSLTRVAAVCLALLLAVMFPANVHAARAGLTVAGRPATPVGPRFALQLFWIGCLVWVAAG